MPGAVENVDLGIGQLAAQAVELAGLGPWVRAAMEHEHGHPDLSEAPLERVLVRRGRDIEPCFTTGANDRAPVLAKVGRQLRRDTRAKRVGVARHPREELARARL